MTTSKFIISKAANEQFKWNLHAGNNEVILTGNLHKTAHEATANLEAARKQAASESNFEIRTAKDGSPYFVLLSADKKEVLGKSEMYSSKSACNNGLKSVIKNAPGAVVKEIEST